LRLWNHEATNRRLAAAYSGTGFPWSAAHFDLLRTIYRTRASIAFGKVHCQTPGKPVLLCPPLHASEHHCHNNTNFSGQKSRLISFLVTWNSPILAVEWVRFSDAQRPLPYTCICSPHPLPAAISLRVRLHGGAVQPCFMPSVMAIIASLDLAGSTPSLIYYIATNGHGDAVTGCFTVQRKWKTRPSCIVCLSLVRLIK
jgi:hypothetical protein